MSCFRLRTIVVFGFTWPGAVLGDVVINEIHYDANPKTDAVEFVELHNAGGKDVDLSGWRFSNGIQYTFPANTTLEPGGQLVVAENPTELRRKFKLSASVVFGPYTTRRISALTGWTTAPVFPGQRRRVARAVRWS